MVSKKSDSLPLEKNERSIQNLVIGNFIAANTDSDRFKFLSKNIKSISGHPELIESQ